MSYDVDLHIGPQTPCPMCGHSAQESGKEVFSRNHTSNTAEMWRKAGCDLAAYDGKLAHELAAALESAIVEIASHPDTYREFEPANGWGNMDTTLAFLRAIHSACLEFPSAVASVCH